jgi:K(+)-stimulated pyrophosphate-energized sodium pump
VAVTNHASNIIAGKAVSLQATVLPVAVISAGMWITYSQGDGTYGVAVVAAALLSMAGIVVVIYLGLGWRSVDGAREACPVD